MDTDKIAEKNVATPHPQCSTEVRSGFTPLDGHLHARYAALFEEMGRNQELKFTGVPSHYPIYRHKLVQKYTELAQSEPELLLRFIENTVSGTAYDYIKNAWVMRKPHDAIVRIWETLERIYGHP